MKTVMSIVLSVGMMVSSGALYASGGGYGSYGTPMKRQAMASSEENAVIDGNCTVCLIEMGTVVKGSSEYSLSYEGKTYLFPGEKQMRMFQKNPRKYSYRIEEKYHAINHAGHGHHHGDSHHEGSHM